MLSLSKNDVIQAINTLKNMSKTHKLWAKYFEFNPEIEKRYVDSGEWHDAKTHRDFVKKYNHIINVLEKVLKHVVLT